MSLFFSYICLSLIFHSVEPILGKGPQLSILLVIVKVFTIKSKK